MFSKGVPKALVLKPKIKMEKTNYIEELSKLHPTAQVTVIVVIGAVLCMLIYQFYKTLRGE